MFPELWAYAIEITLTNPTKDTFETWFLHSTSADPVHAGLSFISMCTPFERVEMLAPRSISQTWHDLSLCLWILICTRVTKIQNFVSHLHGISPVDSGDECEGLNSPTWYNVPNDYSDTVEQLA